MQEIAPHIYIETSYAGVTLGAINWSHGLILIDAPFRAEDIRSWRSALLNLGGGVDRLLINLDAHYDRTLGARAMDCTLLGHEKMAQVFRNRPVTFKAQGTETGAEWEQYNGLGSIRWAPPEITFTNDLFIHWDDSPLTLEDRPGPAAGSIWAILPNQKIIFLGDTVVSNQPPFLAGADLPAWIELLNLLLSEQYQNYTMISGRGGLIAMDEVRAQLAFLTEARSLLTELISAKAGADETANLVAPLMKSFRLSNERRTQAENRLRWGLHQYYLRKTTPNSDDFLEE